MLPLGLDACYRAIATRDARFDGKLFTGVKTTGIYCRPICPARTPKKENVVFFASAAAAQEAGFRPCLRCRPETSPDLGAWHGTSNTVARALRLIEAGALDAGDVDALAARLGVGERQLRRLFKQHVGASPIAVAQTRRVLLAKQLIHETRLPMTQVALASGFGSVRRFNETFQQLYDRPPASLRRMREGEENEREGDAITLELPYRPPYDWDAMLAFLAARAIPGVESVRDGRYARTFAIGDASGAVSVERSPRAGFLRVALRSSRIEALPAVIARVRRVFDLSADPVAIAEHLAEDPILAPRVASRPGLRVPGAWDGFELAVRAILGQQITVVAARALAGKIARAAGSRVSPSVSADLTHVFPRPRALVDLDLARLGMPKARAAAIHALATAAARDASLFVGHGELEDVVRKLRRLPGVGEWTAQYIAMRELREPDAFPAADVGLMRALAGADGRRPSPEELLERAERWRPWRAYAALHLWSSSPPKAAKTRRVA
ncbi:MAG: helix-turn-helix domain-containing protein [Labilithrix sp.]|nr:helix-turn-helix domain-containing protein [Labilithrix sp.]